MHGHPFSGPTQLWWGKGALAKRPRTLFFDPAHDMPSPSDMFRAGGFIDDAGNVTDRAGLHTLMATLDRRASAGEEPEDNRNIPSGYTYLLQFIAHDMVDSVPAFAINGDSLVPDARNARSMPLMLETLYGTSPDEAPHAYLVTKRQADSGLIPRTRLRTGLRMEPTPGGDPSPARDPYCPFRDIARNTPQKAPDGRTDVSRNLTEVMLADARNDAHAIISQLTILFQLLHNHVVALIESATGPLAQDHDLPPRELAYRQFQCARMVVVSIYRNIIEKDVLRRLLDERIHKRYLVERQALLDRGGGIPLEFSFGAFRFAHAIVRETYTLNSFAPEGPIREALRRSAAQAHRGRLPIGPSWFVDWAHFFENRKNIEPNFSTRITPRYTAGLSVAPEEFPIKVEGVDTQGLMHRDLLSGAFAGVLSVPALIRIARVKGIDSIEEFPLWQTRLRTWLSAVGGLLTAAEIEAISKDPPLLLFVMFEAARIETGDEDNGGQRLGPLGSVILAETILGSMAECPLGVEGAALKDRIKACGQVLFNTQPTSSPSGEPDKLQLAVCEALASIDEIEGMTALLEYMERKNLFAQD